MLQEAQAGRRSGGAPDGGHAERHRGCRAGRAPGLRGSGRPGGPARHRPPGSAAATAAGRLRSGNAERPGWPRWWPRRRDAARCPPGRNAPAGCPGPGRTAGAWRRPCAPRPRRPAPRPRGRWMPRSRPAICPRPARRAAGSARRPPRRAPARPSRPPACPGAASTGTWTRRRTAPGGPGRECPRSHGRSHRESPRWCRSWWRRPAWPPGPGPGWPGTSPAGRRGAWPAARRRTLTAAACAAAASRSASRPWPRSRRRWSPAGAARWSAPAPARRSCRTRAAACRTPAGRRSPPRRSSRSARAGWPRGRRLPRAPGPRPARRPAAGPPPVRAGWARCRRCRCCCSLPRSPPRRSSSIRGGRAGPTGTAPATRRSPPARLPGPAPARAGRAASRYCACRTRRWPRAPARRSRPGPSGPGSRPRRSACRPGLLDRQQVAQVAVEPVIGVLADRAGVEYDHVRGFPAGGALVTGVFEQPASRSESCMFIWHP